MNKASGQKSKQQSFFKNQGKHKYCHGGELRKRRIGRKARPLSAKESHHIVFKINRLNLRRQSFRHPKNFMVVQKILQKYAQKFFIKIESISYQHNHIHICARSARRSFFHNFFRVFSGQIAQNLKVTDTPKNHVLIDKDKGKGKGESKASHIEKKKIVLWKCRPYTRIVKGWRNYQTLRNYIQLNENEVTGQMPYKKNRLKDLSNWDCRRLWS